MKGINHPKQAERKFNDLNRDLRSRGGSTEALAMTCVVLVAVLAIIMIEKSNNTMFGILAVAVITGVLRGLKRLK